MSLVFFCEFGKNLQILQNLWVPQVLLGDWLRIGHLAVIKKLCCVACFVYSIIITPSLVVLINHLCLNP